MASMFETIRDLPLLKGISEEQVAQFLEHTNVRFSEYAPGQTILTAADDVTDLRFVINGTVRISHKSKSGRFTLHHTPPQGHPLFAYRLFGLSNSAAAVVSAVTTATILSFPKSDYLNLLCSDHIYQISTLNYLSARAQHSMQTALIDTPNSLATWLTRLLLTLTPRGAYDISIDINANDTASITGLDQHELKSQIATLTEEQLIRQTKNTINIINRNELIDYVLHTSEIQD